MRKFNSLTGVVAPLDKDNVDTDQIIPKQYLKSIRRSGFGPNLFDSWRYLDSGEAHQDPSTRAINPDFILNQPPYDEACILLTRANFGCGSSREHAVWALADFGIYAVIASSFADIFRNNCFKNGVLPLALSLEQIEQLFQHSQQATLSLTIDLAEQKLSSTELGINMSFTIEADNKRRLLEGLDDIGITMTHRETISAYEDQRRSRFPWLFRDFSSS